MSHLTDVGAAPSMIEASAHPAGPSWLLDQIAESKGGDEPLSQWGGSTVIDVGWLDGDRRECPGTCSQRESFDWLHEGLPDYRFPVGHAGLSRPRLPVVGACHSIRTDA